MYFVASVLNGLLDSLDVRATHVSLHTADPGSTGAAEVGDLPYLRQPLVWSAASGGVKTASPVTFQVPGGTTITHLGLWDSVTGGVFAGGALLDGPEVFAVDGPYVLAVTVTTDAITALPLSGGRLSGPLSIAVEGAADIEDLPLGPRSAARNTGLNLIGSYAGGEDEAGGTDFDSSARLNIYGYQRAEYDGYAEQIRKFLMRKDAKIIDSWYVPKNGYDNTSMEPNEGEWMPVAWLVAHVGSNDDPDVLHSHFSIELPDASGAVQTRLEFPFGPQGDGAAQTFGVDHTNIKTNLADLTIRADGSTSYPGGKIGILRISGSNTNEKVLEFGTGNAETGWEGGIRWRLVGNSTTESGSNAGSDFALRRYQDSGVLGGTALFIKRSNGNIALGQASAEGARLTAVWSTSGDSGFLAKPSASPGAGAAFAGQLTAVGDRFLDSRVSGDGVARLLVFTDGKVEWGDGTATRDTNLYRSSADLLRTDDDFRARSITVDGTVRAGFFKATSTTQHALTVYQAGTSGIDVAAALNVVSDNPQSSAMYLSGGETNRGTLKVTHRNLSGSTTGDAAAAALSLDLRQAGAGGTAAKGIFLDATDGGTTGDLVDLRNGGSSLFRVTAGGVVIAPNMQRARLERYTDLTLTSGAVTAVPLTTSVHQVGGTWWTTGTDITVPAGASGLYIVYARAIFKDGAPNTGDRSVWVRRKVGGPLVDDPPVAAMTPAATGTAIWPDVTATSVASLTAGQTYYVSVRHGLGTDLVLYGVEVAFVRLLGL